MKSLFLYLFIGSLLSGCTVYKSEGRKQFESQAPEKLATSFQLVGCKTENKIQTWLNDEFPSASYEVVIAHSDLEVWRHLRPDGVVEVKALQREPVKTLACTYRFASEMTWELYKPQFLRELENNWMSLE